MARLNRAAQPFGGGDSTNGWVDGVEFWKETHKQRERGPIGPLGESDRGDRRWALP
jgi:hypothetical protein